MPEPPTNALSANSGYFLLLARYLAISGKASNLCLNSKGNSRTFNDEKSENTIHFAILFHEVFDVIGTGKNFIFVPGAENAPHLLAIWVKSNTF